MKTLLKLGEMLQYLPTEVKDAINHVAKETGNKTDSLELHRHTHSEKSKVNGLDPKSRQSLSYVSARTQDRDDEIVIPKAIELKEFRKYMHCLVNHNYSLLPVGSDEQIEADDYGIKALTTHADTGEGTLANVVWALVSQGHLKSKSIGFVPTSFTKPGARDWDHVANQLQSNWGEFDKSRAEKSISRIITGGVLLEHSFVSVPCNADAEMISVCKAMHLEGTVAKQLGWEMKDGILVTKAAAADPVPCACDECGFVKDAVVGSRCPECKTGTMKAKGKEKAIEVRVISKGDVPGHEFHGNQFTGGDSSGPGGSDPTGGVPSKTEVVDMARKLTTSVLDHPAINTPGPSGRTSRSATLETFRKLGKDEQRTILSDVLDRSEHGVGRQFARAFASVIPGTGGMRSSSHEQTVAKPKIRESIISDAQRELNKKSFELDTEQDETKGFHSHAVEKPNAHMPGGSFSACVLLMEDKGHDSESAKKICGALQADAGGKGLTEAETKAVREVTGKALPLPCTCDECGAEDECAPGSACQEPDCEGTMVADKGKKGGPGSGNFGHSGRPGEQGGSGEGGGGPSGSTETSIVNQEKQTDAAWRASKASDGSPKGEERAASAHDRAALAASAVVKNPPKNLAEFGDEGYTIEHYEAQIRMHESQAALHRARAKEPAPTEEQRRAGSAFFGKSFSPEIKVVRPAPSVKVLFVPPSGSEIAQRVGEAVEKALSRRTGKIM